MKLYPHELVALFFGKHEYVALGPDLTFAPGVLQPSDL
jgi:hypothetical protein